MSATLDCNLFPNEPECIDDTTKDPSDWEEWNDKDYDEDWEDEWKMKKR
jgi:hypothetical protein